MTSKTTSKLRRLRQRFGIGAPRVAIRRHIPWYWRVLSGIVLVAAVAFILWGYETFYLRTCHLLAHHAARHGAGAVLAAARTRLLECGLDQDVQIPGQCHKARGPGGQLRRGHSPLFPAARNELRPRCLLLSTICSSCSAASRMFFFTFSAATLDSSANPDSITPLAGKAFIGWKIEGTDEFVYPKEIVKMRVGGIKLVAQWENKKHTTYLKYDYNFNKFGIQESGANYNRIDGVKINTRIDLIPFGNMATAPQGYTFTGWYLDKDCKDGPYDRVLVDTSGNGHNTVLCRVEQDSENSGKARSEAGAGNFIQPGSDTGSDKGCGDHLAFQIEKREKACKEACERCSIKETCGKQTGVCRDRRCTENRR